MSYQVLARKWRPQCFEQVVGQEIVTRTLQNAITNGRVAHAFLFSGVRGVGKTSTARILAKALNCQKGPTPSPCGECLGCQEIAATNNVDVLEIDAASNTGVDNVRELRESVRYGTARDRFKIFIIDEVHMLSNAAFNALLKTLEEPPPHVKFILATTEYHKIPLTITSRCQQFDFKPISFPLILERLKLISREEGIEISDYALRAIAAAAQGSMRDAQSALDQIMAFSGKQIGDEDVRTLLGVVDERAVITLLEAVLQRDKKSLIEQVQELVHSGVDPQNFCRKLIHHVRNLMVCKVTGWEERLLNLPDTEKEAILKQAEQFSELDLIRFYDVLNRTHNELRWHSHPHVHLEMTLMKLIELAQLPTVEQVIDELKSEQKLGSQRQPAQPVQSAQGRTLFEALSKGSSGEVKKERKSESPTESKDKEEPGSASPVISHLLSAVQIESIRLYSSLQHASQTTFGNGKLSIVFPTGEAFHHGVVLESENQERLSRLCAKITGSTPEIEVKLEEPLENLSDPTKNPKVKAFIETFPGKVIVEKEIED
ncbi:DNA polymerase III subunit gamma/tau [Acidobacteria bacterium AH-259-O06]|nr:DNA polymerase III subunit gamma/tau [Acidobacteria bacterium AH-259-O06]